MHFGHWEWALKFRLDWSDITHAACHSRLTLDVLYEFLTQSKLVTYTSPFPCSHLEVIKVSVSLDGFEVHGSEHLKHSCSKSIINTHLLSYFLFKVTIRAKVNGNPPHHLQDRQSSNRRSDLWEPSPQKITEIHFIYLISYRLNFQGPQHSI